MKRRVGVFGLIVAALLLAGAPSRASTCADCGKEGFQVPGQCSCAKSCKSQGGCSLCCDSQVSNTNVVGIPSGAVNGGKITVIVMLADKFANCHKGCVMK